MFDLEGLVRQAGEQGSSDVHLVYGIPPKCRIDGSLVNLRDKPLSESEDAEMAQILAGDRFEEIKEIGELDLSQNIAGHRVRINLFRSHDHFSAALRILSDTIPELSSLGLPPVVNDFPTYRKGIVLVTGETGSGKSTTLAAILNHINHTRRQHIITLEDPIEYVYEPDLCVINQREIGTDTHNYADALRAALRQDPDIILIGEMRDPETIETALTAAETGHLVFATLHTNSASDSVNRIVSVFEAGRQDMIRMQLSTTLKAVLSQQLLLRKEGHGRAAACEVMLNTSAIANLIREGKIPQITSSIMMSARLGAITMDDCLANMTVRGTIDRKTAMEACNDKEYLKKKLL